MAKHRRSQHINLISDKHIPKKKKFSTKRVLLLALPIICILSGVYLLIVLNAPKLTSTTKVNQSQPVKQNKIIIPKIGVDADLHEGDNSALDKGAWHRHPERGDPEMGGNFIVTGHRFKFGVTPALVKEASVFYNIDKLQPGNEIIAHWKGKKYTYKVTKIYQVNPGEVKIEAPSETRMTLYTCTLSGSADGRVVIEASLQ